jgi:hypothetical protein
MAAATRTATKLDIGITGLAAYQWAGLDGDDVGSVVKLPSYDKLTVQIGTSGGNTDGGATTVMQGTNDPLAESDPANAVWFTLTEKSTGDAVSVTTDPGLFEVNEHPLYIRPSQSGGSSGDLDVIAVAR